MRWFGFVFVIGAASIVACVGDAPDTSCDAYCAQIANVCTGSDAQYVFLTGTMDTSSSCHAICALFPKTMEAIGNSQKCRADQLTLVDEAKGNAMQVHQHCMDAGPFSEICGGRNANFCRIDIAQCGATAFGTQADCEAAFANVPDGLDKGVNDSGVPAINTKACRFYHVEKTTEAVMTHCPHTKAPVSPVCVN
jgi:hypothetical protein